MIRACAAAAGLMLALLGAAAAVTAWAVADEADRQRRHR